MQRVVVTGMGAVSPLGITMHETWSNLLRGYSGVTPIEFPNHTNMPCKIAATIPQSDSNINHWRYPSDFNRNDNESSSSSSSSQDQNNEYPQRGKITTFDSKDWINDSESYYKSNSILFGLASSHQAIVDAKLSQHQPFSQFKLNPNERNTITTLKRNSDDKSEMRENSNSNSNLNLDSRRIGVCFGTGMGGIDTTEHSILKMNNSSYRKLSPFTICNLLTNSSGSSISIRYGCHGPNLTPSTACAAGSHALQEAYMLIANGICDIVIAGAVESSITPLGIASFTQCKALCTNKEYNIGINNINNNNNNNNYANSTGASRPFDINRNGFVMGEGSATLVLESYDHALKKRMLTKNDIYAELVGIGSTCDGYHITSPEPNGTQIMQCMENAIRHCVSTSNNNNNDIDEKDRFCQILSHLGYVNAHATSTKLGDITEVNAIVSLIERLGKEYGLSDEEINTILTDENNNGLKISSTKSSTGHLLGAAGAIEACFTILSLYHLSAPPTLNLHQRDDQISPNVNLVANQTQNMSSNTLYALSNSFGFGGTNGSLLFRSVM